MMRLFVFLQFELIYFYLFVYYLFLKMGYSVNKKLTINNL